MKGSQVPEALNRAGLKRAACVQCGLYSGPVSCKRPQVPDEWTGKIVVAVTGNESKSELRILRKAWRAAGWEDSDVAIVPAVRCAKSEPTMLQIRACRPFLLRALLSLSADHIIAIGTAAMRACRDSGEQNIIKNRGREYEIPCDIPPTASGGRSILS